MASERAFRVDDGDHSGVDFLTEMFKGLRGVELSLQIHAARATALELRQYVPVLLEALERFEAEPPDQIADRSLAARALDQSTRARIREEVDNYLSDFKEKVDSLPFYATLAECRQPAVEFCIESPWDTSRNGNFVPPLE